MDMPFIVLRELTIRVFIHPVSFRNFFFLYAYLKTRVYKAYDRCRAKTCAHWLIVIYHITLLQKRLMVKKKEKKKPDAAFYHVGIITYQLVVDEEW